MNLGELADSLFGLREQKSNLKAELSDIEKDISEVEYKLISAMEDTGLNQMRSNLGLVTKKVAMYPQVDDIAPLVKWAFENGRPELLQRRVSKSVFDEILNDTGEMPDGVKVYDKKTLNYTKAK